MGVAREGSVTNLQELYTVAVGAALTLAIVRFVPEVGHPAWSSFPVLLTFVVTLVPFYHGAMRHLDVTYRESRGDVVREGSLLGDFFLLFTEACLFLAFASAITNTAQASWTLVALLAVDGLWGLAAYWVFAKTRRSWAEIRWSVINIVTAVLLVGFLRVVGAWPWAPQAQPPGLGLAVIGVGRTVADYYWSWRFYFPRTVVRK